MRIFYEAQNDANLQSVWLHNDIHDRLKYKYIVFIIFGVQLNVRNEKKNL